MVDIIQFQPQGVASCYRITADTNGEVATLPVMPQGNNYNVMIANAGTATAWIAFETSAAVTVTVPAAGGAAGGMCVPSGAIITCNAPTRYLSAITVSGTADINITIGSGS